MSAYDMAITNLANYFQNNLPKEAIIEYGKIKQTPQSRVAFDAFEASSVLSVVFCKDKSEILIDIVKKQNESKIKKETNPMMNLHTISDNLSVLNCNDLLVDGSIFSDVYGGICGSNNAILIDESLEEMFELSKITCVYSEKEKLAHLTQNGKTYKVDIVSCDEGSTDESDHFDFRTMELVK